MEGEPMSPVNNASEDEFEDPPSSELARHDEAPSHKNKPPELPHKLEKSKKDPSLQESNVQKDRETTTSKQMSSAKIIVPNKNADSRVDLGEGKLIATWSLKNKKDEAMKANIYEFQHPKNENDIIYAMLYSDFKSIITGTIRTNTGYIKDNIFTGVIPRDQSIKKEIVMNIAAIYKNLKSKQNPSESERWSVEKMKELAKRDLNLIFNEEPKKKAKPANYLSDYGNGTEKNKELNDLFGRKGVALSDFERMDEEAEEEDEEEAEEAEEIEDEYDEEYDSESQAEEVSEEETERIQNDYRAWDRRAYSPKKRKISEVDPFSEPTNHALLKQSAESLCDENQRNVINAAYEKYLETIYRSLSEVHAKKAKLLEEKIDKKPENGKSNLTKK